MAATLTPAATTGKDKLFIASETCFLVADVGRQIIYQASRAIIIAFGVSAGDTTNPNTTVHADIIDDFPNTQPIPAHEWFLRLSPQSDLTPDKKGPVGTKVTLTANKHTFRIADNGKYIHIYGGVVEIQGITSTTVVVGEILNELQVDEISAGSGTYPAAIAGTWTLEVSSWSPINGYPRTGEFAQGRLVQASTPAQPTTFWMSAPDDFDNYAVGIKASDAVEYTIATRQLNRIEWIVEDLEDLVMGGTNKEMRATSGKLQEPFGGDVVPKVNPISDVGSAPVQALLLSDKVMFLDRSRRQIFVLAYSAEDDRKIPVELTAIAEHITESGIRLGPIAYQKRYDRRIYFVRNDGTLIALTYFPNEKVIGFVRIVTDGFFEAVATNTHFAGRADLVYVIVRRVINGVTKRYVEVFDDQVGNSTQPWESLQTDCALFYNTGLPTLTVPVPWLDGKMVDVVADGSFIGQLPVTAGVVTLPEEHTQIEIGLHYDSIVTTMRPTVEGVNIEGLPRSWKKLWARFKDTLGGTINDEAILYPPPTLNSPRLFTGDRETTAQPRVDSDGRVTIVQSQPYPMTLLSIFGTLEIGDHD